MSAENLFFMANASDLEYDEDDDDKSIYSLCSSDDFDIECQSEQGMYEISGREFGFIVFFSNFSSIKYMQPHAAL